MKRIIACCVAILCAAPVVASTICAEDDVIAIVLDPTIAGTAYTADVALMEWGATFPYGSVWGVGACVDVAGTATGQIAPENFTDSNGEPVVGGEVTERHCWCQMRHPARSRWVFRRTNSSIDACRSLCAGYCGDNVRNDAATRSGMFGSVGN